MPRQTPQVLLSGALIRPHLLRLAWCTLWLACSLSPVSASGLQADSANQLVFDSLSRTLITSPADLPDGQTLSGQDFAQLHETPGPLSPQVPANINARVHSVLTQALAQLGTPYRWGGSTPNTGFDCSGLVRYVFKTALGIELPRISREQAQGGLPVKQQELTPGDLVFFSRSGKGINHVGIYLGDGRFVHAPRRGRNVSISKLEGYWHKRFLQARRIADLHDSGVS